jgi:flavin reductase (DIM6/NTAB) family NADH-FMN oxidoreductase RutF
MTLTEAGLNSFAPVLGRVPSGLFILTAGHGPSETGLLASWVQQCSFGPPRVSVAVKAGRDVASLLHEGMPFTLNILGDGQKNLLAHFGKGFGPGEPAFVGLDVGRPECECVVLKDALGYLFCRSAGRFPAGDHDLFLGDVVGGQLLLPEGKPYVHVRKSGLRY